MYGWVGRHQGAPGAQSLNDKVTAVSVISGKGGTFVHLSTSSRASTHAEGLVSDGSYCQEKRQFLARDKAKITP